MERDRQLLRDAEAGQSQIRIYGWSSSWVSLGHSQNPLRDLKPGSELPYVMRPTGGGGVLHGHDITLGFAKPLLNGQSPRSLRAIYLEAIQPLIEALRTCRIPATFGTTINGPTISSDCFAQISRNDIVDERTGAKVCGCALKVTDRAVLLQASIPIKSPLVNPQDIFINAAPAQWVDLNVTDLTQALNASQNLFAMK